MKRIFLNCLGINNAAGGDLVKVYQSVFLERKLLNSETRLFSARKTFVMKVSDSLPSLPSKLTEFDSRNNRLLLHAALQIQKELDLFLRKFGKGRVGIVLGTSTSGIDESEKVFHGNSEGPLPPHFNYYKQEVSNASNFLARFLGLESIHYTVSTACTSSAKTFIEGKRLLNSGMCDAVIVGGVDTLSHLTLNGFDSLDSVAPGLTNPFSKNRQGINIGEGAAIFILSHVESEVEFLGFGESSDAYHLSAPDPQGVGAEIALRSALSSSRLSPQDIGYINLHGTGTPKNDFMEGHLVKRVFGESVPVSSTKPFIGHTLGAAGAQEAALCYLAISSINKSKKLPMHVWDGVQDPELPTLAFVHDHQLTKNICMSNSFAFGGNNVSLIFGGSQ